MSVLWLLLIFPVACLVLVGCGENSPPTSPSQPVAPVSSPDDLFLKAPQPKLPTMKLYIGSQEVIAEVALTMEQTARGMMFRTNMAENEAMLFVFQRPERRAFWMKNCPLPLSVAYIDPAGVIQEIHDLHPYNTNSVPSRGDYVQYAIEVNQGWFERHNVTPGALVTTERGPLRDVFGSR